MNEKAEKLFCGITNVGDDLIQEAGTVQKRKKTASWRWGAIAACLCIALVGTTFAAMEILDIRIAWEDKSGLSSNAYTVETAVNFYPADCFTEEVIALCAASPNAHKNFDTWDEMEEFIGLDIVNNPVLDRAEPGPKDWYGWRNDEEKATHILLLPNVTDSGELFDIFAGGSYLLDGIWIRMDESIYTEKSKENLHNPGLEGEGSQPWYIRAYAEGVEVTEKTYTTAHGLDVTIVEVPQKTSEVVYDAYFLINGVRFTMTASIYPEGRSENPAHTLEVLKTVLDGFQV